MLRITVQEEPNAVTVKVEGRIVGSWVEELRRVWFSLDPSLRTKDLCIDLCEVTFVDAAGTHLLTDIRKSGVPLLADTPMIQHMVEEIERAGRN